MCETALLKQKIEFLEQKVEMLKEQKYRLEKDIEETQDASVNYPLIADQDLRIAKLYNMLPADEPNDVNRTALTNATVRSIFLIDPEKKIRMMLTYPMTTGRNFNEIFQNSL